MSETLKQFEDRSISRRAVLKSAGMLATGSLFAQAPLAGATPSSQQATGSDPVLIKAAVVHPVAGSPIVNGQVLIENGKIAAVGKDLKAPGNAVLVEFKTGHITPGLVDMQTSLGLPGDGEVTKEIAPSFRVRDSVDWRSTEFRAAIAEGVTTAHVSPGATSVIGGLSFVTKTAGRPGERVFPILKQDAGLFIGLCSEPAGGNASRNRPSSIYTRQPTNRMGIVWMLRSEFGKVRSKADRGTELTTDEMIIKQMMDGKYKLFAISHAENDLEGVLRIADEYGLKPTIVGGEEAYRIIPQFKEKKTAIVLTKIPLDAAAIGEDSSEMHWGQANLLEQAGLTFAFANGELLTKARFAIRYGLSEASALKAITQTPAQLLGVDDLVGSLAVGKQADLLVFNKSPFDPTAEMVMTMLDGRTVTALASRGVSNTVD